MKNVCLSALLVVSAVMASPCCAQDSAASSSGDQKRFLHVVQSLEAAPLNPRLRVDRAWAMQWLIDAPDLTVTVCLEPLNGMSLKDFNRSDDIVAQYSLSMAAFIIKHPELENDKAAQQIAGVESALKSYQVMRDANASSKSRSLEELLEVQRRGGLSSFVRKAYLKCSGKSTPERSFVESSANTAVWKEIWNQPGVATFYADPNSIATSNSFRTLTTKAQYRPPLPEGYIAERIRVEEFDCERHRSRLRQSMIFGNDGREPQTVEWTPKKAAWINTEAGSLGRTKEDLACAASPK